MLDFIRERRIKNERNKWYNNAIFWMVLKLWANLWKKISEDAEKLSKLGITAIWFPPAFKGIGGSVIA